MLPSPTAEPMAAKMNAVRPEKAPRSALGATAPADGDVALMEASGELRRRGRRVQGADDGDGPGKCAPRGRRRRRSPGGDRGPQGWAVRAGRADAGSPQSTVGK